MKNNMKKISVLIMACSMGVAAQAQLIDPLTGSLSGYTDYLVNDVSHAGGLGISFTSSASGLSANYVGTGTSAEQALFLAPVGSFSTIFAVGDMLTVNVNIANTVPLYDFGLAVAANNPSAATAAADSTGAWSSRGLFDWASVSYRQGQTAIRNNTSISGSVVTAANVINGVASSAITELFIEWNSADVFTLGYFNGATQITSEMATFAPGSTIGSEIGFYADTRATGNSLGFFNNLTISPIPIPEPTAMALCGLGGLLGLVGWMRRKNS